MSEHATCPREHRLPEGPNEDISTCPQPDCWRPTFTLRPIGETYGTHLPDCSLEERHLSYCQPGGQGHPPAQLIRGYWPVPWRVPYQIHQGIDKKLMVDGTLHVNAETPNHARQVALQKAMEDLTHDIFDHTTISIEEPQRTNE